MEVLQLPHDLYWGTKTEPQSPPSDDQLFPSISLFSPKLESDDEAEDVIIDTETEEMIAAALMNGEILLQLEICEEENGQWDCIQGANYSSHLLPLAISELKDSTSELKRYPDSTDIIQLSPQTYTSENFNFAINYPYTEEEEQPQQVQEQEAESELQKLDYESFFCDLNLPTYQKSKEECIGSPTSSSSAYEELSESERGDEIVDEILRIHTKNLPDFNDDNDSQYSSASYSSTSDDTASSYKNNSINSMSPISNRDWPLLTTSDEYSSQENLQQIDSKVDNFNRGQTIKKRSRLYVRNVDEKKSRKKEQNKNAATRYRQKKKMEIKLDLDEETVLLDKNKNLRKTVEDYQREMKYLKKLIKEFYKNDGK